MFKKLVLCCVSAVLLGCTCTPPECLKTSGFDPNTPHQVGKLEGRALVSDGRPGFLLYGPYVAMQAGKYRLKVYGQAERADSAWVDVVSDKGKTQHAKFPIAQGSGTLAQGEVELQAQVSDLEVRVYVDPNAKVKLEGYEFKPAS